MFLAKPRLQVFAEKAGQSFFTSVKVAILSKLRSSLPKATTQRAIILANGPSLTATINSNPTFFKNENTTLFCVNHFANSDFYADLKPSYYIMLPPQFWIDEYPAIEIEIQKRKRLFHSIETRTTWPMTILIPYAAKDTKTWKTLFDNNPNISICHYNNTPAEGFSTFRHWLFRNNLAMPRPHNVLIPSIWSAINMGFKEVFLVGADHSWFKELRVTDNNEVLINEKHFYDIGSSKHLPLYNAFGKRKMYEVLDKWLKAFKGYFILKEYAESKDVHIWNATPDSYIDAFNRYKIPKLV